MKIMLLARLRHAVEHRVEQPRLHAEAASLQRAEDPAKTSLKSPFTMPLTFSITKARGRSLRRDGHTSWNSYCARRRSLACLMSRTLTRMWRTVEHRELSGFIPARQALVNGQIRDVAVVQRDVREVQTERALPRSIPTPPRGVAEARHVIAEPMMTRRS